MRNDERTFAVTPVTMKLVESLRLAKDATEERRIASKLNRALGDELAQHLQLEKKPAVFGRPLFDVSRRPRQGEVTARRRLVVLRVGCDEYYGYYDDETQQCIYIGVGYVEGCAD